jgi:central kinetochore subunit Mal2/MCM21
MISAQSTQEILQGLRNNTRTQLQSPNEANPVRERILARSKAQEAHNQQCLYRICASITTFKVRDPDPNAVDGGNVLGVRFEVMTKAQFLRPYYVMLNRPYPNSRYLRVHKHTVPPCIPLPGLAARYLPSPPAPDSERQSHQDISQFVRRLRREIVRHHNRIAIVADIRKALGLGPSTGESGEEAAERTIKDASVADPEAKQIKIDFTDGRTGRIVMDEDGKMLKFVVFGENGRERRISRDLEGDDVRIETMIEKLKSLER